MSLMRLIDIGTCVATSNGRHGERQLLNIHRQRVNRCTGSRGSAGTDRATVHQESIEEADL